MRGYDQKIPEDSFGEEIIRRYKNNPEKLIKFLFTNRKMSSPEYIQIKLLFEISKTLNELIKETKGLLESLK